VYSTLPRGLHALLRASRLVTSYMLFAEKVNVSSLVIEKEVYVESIMSVFCAVLAESECARVVPCTQFLKCN
jgi:hypothetical protein